MPFTPFHFGPGLLLKGLAPNQFSLSIFALSNVAMDVEPLYHILRGDAHLHGMSHTLVGAAFIAVLAATSGRVVAMHAWRFYENRAGWHEASQEITRLQAWIGALTGTFSHLLLAAVVYTDVHPLLPLTEYNPVLEITWTQNMYLACVLAGMLGIFFLLMRAALAPSRDTDI